MSQNDLSFGSNLIDKSRSLIAGSSPRLPSTMVTLSGNQSLAKRLKWSDSATLRTFSTGKVTFANRALWLTQELTKKASLVVWVVVVCEIRVWSMVTLQTLSDTPSLTNYALFNTLQSMTCSSRPSLTKETPLSALGLINLQGRNRRDKFKQRGCQSC